MQVFSISLVKQTEGAVIKLDLGGVTMTISRGHQTSLLRIIKASVTVCGPT